MLLGEPGSRDGDDPLGKQEMAGLAAEVAGSDSNGGIERPAVDLGIPVEQPQPEVTIAECPVQAVDARDDPLLGDPGVGRQHERAGMLGEFGETGLDHVEAGGDVRAEAMPEVGQGAAIRAAAEQLGSEAALERPDLAGHRRLGHAQLGCGRREAPQPGRRLEHRQPL